MTTDRIVPQGVQVSSLSWTPWGARPILDDISFTASRGERILVTGASGSGKSTLLRAIAGALEGYAPGELEGSVTVSGHPVGDRPGSVGLLLQNPRDQIVAGSVARDAAFGPENGGVSGRPLRDLVRRTLDLVKLDGVALDVRSTRLSGGQGQRLSLAGLLGLQPELLLLDEPLSMLDDDSSAAVVSSIVDAVDAVDATMIVADHDLTAWWPHVHRVIVLEAGRVVFDGAPSAALVELQRQDELWLPGRGAAAPLPIAWSSDSRPDATDEPALHAESVSLSGDGRLRLGSTTVGLVPGRSIGLVGESGAGKSTLLRLLAGWERPSSGTVTASTALSGTARRHPHLWKPREAASRIAFVGQDPAQAIVASTVLEEVLLTRRLTGTLREGDERRARELLDSLALSGREERNPHTLSGGEQRRLAVAVAIATDAPVALFDEPTVGQDRRSWSAVAGAIAHIAQRGGSSLIATHDSHLLAHTGGIHRVEPAAPTTSGARA